jgi:hypothetical protein
VPLEGELGVAPGTDPGVDGLVVVLVPDVPDTPVLVPLFEGAPLTIVLYEVPVPDCGALVSGFSRALALCPSSICSRCLLGAAGSILFCSTGELAVPGASVVVPVEFGAAGLAKYWCSARS